MAPALQPLIASYFAGSINYGLRKWAGLDKQYTMVTKEGDV